MSKTSSANNLSIIPYLYNGNARNILESYYTDLRKVGGRYNLLHANMLEHYVQISEDREFILSLQNLMYTFFLTHVQTYYKVKICGRKKGIISLEDKCNLVLARKSSPSVKDSVGFRIILIGKNTEELIASCYHLMDKCIDFFISKGFNPTDAEKTISTSDFDPKKHPKVIVPKKTLLKRENRIFVKDYIRNPKNKGYQSLHIIFVDSQGREFEVQIRTDEMDEYAEYGPAAHLGYKKIKYKDDDISEESDFSKVDTSQIDIEKISAEGFHVTENEDNPFYDQAGIFVAREFLQLSNL